MHSVLSKTGITVCWLVHHAWPMKTKEQRAFTLYMVHIQHIITVMVAFKPGLASNVQGINVATSIQTCGIYNLKESTHAGQNYEFYVYSGHSMYINYSS